MLHWYLQSRSGKEMPPLWTFAPSLILSRGELPNSLLGPLTGLGSSERPGVILISDEKWAGVEEPLRTADMLLVPQSSHTYLALTFVTSCDIATSRQQTYISPQLFLQV